MTRNNQLATFLERLRSSYWFIPALMAAGAIALSQIAIQIDQAAGAEIAGSVSFLYIDSPEGARAVLSTIATSMITVAGIVFSLTMVVFSLSAQQYGSLVLEHFMRDRTNQFALGTFTATFIYCLLTLRTVRGTATSIFVPHISVLTGVLLALIGVIVLIYFIHYVADSVKSFTIAGRNSHDLLAAIDSLFPQEIGQSPHALEVEEPAEDVPENFEENAAPIRAEESGYLQLIDEQALFDLACKQDTILKLIHHPGDFIIQGSILGYVWPQKDGGGKLPADFNKAFILGDTRTYTQDLAFHVARLVEIGVRSLSPSLNDPFTAQMCIDRLAEALCRLGNRDMPSPYRYDDTGQLRIITRRISFESMVDLSFDMIRYHGCNSPEVLIHLIKTFRVIGECAGDNIDRSVLRRHARLVHEQGRNCFTEQYVQTELDAAYHETLQALAEEADSPDRLKPETV